VKSNVLRFAGVLFAGWILAACSGTQSVVPASQAPVNAPTVSRGVNPDAVRVTFDDAMMARNFVPMKAHVTPMRLKNPYKGLANRPDSTPVGYPLDMTKGTGPTVKSIAAYNIYVNEKNEATWGDPEEFLKGLTGSPFAGLITQYTGGAASGYKFGGSMSVNYSLKYSNTFYNNDLFTILASAVKHFQKVGLTAQYHLFLPPGIDTCFDQYGICYSPDNLNSFVFCAYHSAVAYNGQPILFSVEPYQNATVKIGSQTFYACQNTVVPKGTNRLESGTASTLSHESFETWSDPLPNTGWFNPSYGAEIGDICAYAFMQKQVLGSKSYWIQQEYSNAAHGCASN